MALNAYPIYSYVLFLQHSYHTHNAVPFFGSPGTKIVIVQFGIGRIFTGKLECMFYQFITITNTFYPSRFTSVSTIVIHHFNTNLPSLHLSSISAGNGCNMCAHLFYLGLWSVGISCFILKKPSRRLVVPNQGMPHYKQVVFLSECHQLISRLKIINTRFWIHLLGLHNVFGCNGIELFYNDFL